MINTEQQTLYWQKQLYALCGVHCLNTLLQAPFYDQGKLATIALELDAKQKQLMQAEGVTTHQFLMYMAEDSGNVAEDGNYSIQVLQQALKRIGQGLVIKSGGTYSSISQYLNQEAFIMHLGSHWFSIRKIDGEFYNLNSLYKMPEVIPQEYLMNFFEHFVNQGCQVWVIKGSFPPVSEEMYKDMNDNQLLVSIQKIHDYTEERIVQNVINWTSPISYMVDGAMPHEHIHSKHIGGDAIMAAAVLPKNYPSNFQQNSAAMPKIIKIKQKQEEKKQEQKDGQAAYNYKSPAAHVKHKTSKHSSQQTIKKDHQIKPLKSNYEKFDIADPLQNSQFFQFIRSQIASNLPVEPPSGINISFLVDDSKKITHKFNGSMKIELLYDYLFVVLSAKPLKKKLQFLLEETQTNSPLVNVDQLIGNISDQHNIVLRVKEY